MKWRGDGILRIRILAAAEIDIPEAKENYELSLKLTNKRIHTSLVDAAGPFLITPEARVYSAERSLHEKCIATAFVTNSLANRLIGNFYIQFNKPVVPTRIFTSDEEAEQWLRSFNTGIAVEEREPVMEEEEEEE